MRVFTVCTRPDGWFDALAASCARHGFDLAVLGSGARWGGFVWRLRLVREAVAGLGDACVAVVDAYDVVMLEPCETLLARHRALTRGGRRILFGSEVPLRQFPARHYVRLMFNGCADGADGADGAKGAVRVINAGVYVGPADVVADMLDRLLALRPDDRADDQKLINRVCRTALADFFADHVTQDTRGDAVFTASCLSMLRQFYGRCGAFGLRERDLVNPRTGRRPCVLHATAGIDINPVCRVERLPPGRRPGRIAWTLSNFWTEALIAVAVAALLAALLAVGARALVGPPMPRAAAAPAGP